MLIILFDLVKICLEGFCGGTAWHLGTNWLQYWHRTAVTFWKGKAWVDYDTKYQYKERVFDALVICWTSKLSYVRGLGAYKIRWRYRKDFITMVKHAFPVLMRKTMFILLRGDKTEIIVSNIFCYPKRHLCRRVSAFVNIPTWQDSRFIEDRIPS